MSTPVRYPGSVLSKNSQVRAAALQAGAYAPAAQPAPATAGFYGDTAIPFQSGTAIFSAVRGFIEGDVVNGYIMPWGSDTLVAQTVALHFGLYTIEKGVDLSVARLVAGSMVVHQRALDPGDAPQQVADYASLPAPLGIDASQLHVVGVLPIYPSSGGLWTEFPTGKGIAMTMSVAMPTVSFSTTTIDVALGFSVGTIGTLPETISSRVWSRRIGSLGVAMGTQRCASQPLGSEPAFLL